MMKRMISYESPSTLETSLPHQCLPQEKSDLLNNSKGMRFFLLSTSLYLFIYARKSPAVKSDVSLFLTRPDIVTIAESFWQCNIRNCILLIASQNLPGHQSVSGEAYIQACPR